LFLSRIVKKIKTRTRAESGNYGNAIAFDWFSGDFEEFRDLIAKNLTGIYVWGKLNFIKSTLSQQKSFISNFIK
jgi:hypothetical protein